MSQNAEFFKVLPVAEALERLYAHWQAPKLSESLAVTQALGRVLAQAPLSPIDLPAFVRSSMDGYAIRASDSYGATPSLPAYVRVVGKVNMGEISSLVLERGQAAEIATGAMLPQGADAVVMIEQTQRVPNSDEIELLHAVAPNENLVQVGEDVRQGSPILPIGHTLRPVDLAGLLAVGILELQVKRAPRVGIVGSGDELVDPAETPALGQIREINGTLLAALCQRHGASAHAYGFARDDFDALYGLAKQALDASDLLILTAGSSISTRDLTVAVIEQLGAPGVVQHGLAVKPGKPTILAVCDGKLVIGLPGNPVSAYCVARQVVIPLIQQALGQAPQLISTLSATLRANVPSATGREDSVPVRLIREADGTWGAEPLFGKSNLIFTLVNADGLLTVPLNSGGLRAGTQVDIVPL